MVTIADGNLSGSASMSVTVAKVVPQVDAGADAELSEGGKLARSGFFTESGTDACTATVDYGDGAGPSALTLAANQAFTLDHTYATAGNYTVSVAVTDGSQGTGTSSFVVTVDNLVPVVNLGASIAIPQGETLTRSGSFTDPGVETWTGTVDYGDGTTQHPDVQSLAINTDKTFNLSHVYAAQGTYNVVVSIHDGGQTAGMGTLTVNVGLPAPTVDAGPDAALHEGDVLRQTGSFSESTGSGWTATVNYGDGTGIQNLALASDKSFLLNHQYTDAGAYTATVNVKDNNSCVGSAGFQVSVADTAPVPTLTGDAYAIQSSRYALELQAADPSRKETMSWTVDWGDGTTPARFVGRDVMANHYYAATGPAKIHVTVTDGVSTPVSSDLNITVIPPQPQMQVCSDGVPVSNGDTISLPNDAIQGVDDVVKLTISNHGAARCN